VSGDAEAVHEEGAVKRTQRLRRPSASLTYSTGAVCENSGGLRPNRRNTR